MVALLGWAVSLALPLLTFGNPHGASVHVHRHKDIVARVKGDMQLHKRFDGTRWTWYQVGLGACGKYNVPSDFIVALNSAQYGGGYPGPNCFKSITMRYNGKTATATIMDECPSCPFGGLDLSEGLFQFFSSLGTGVISGSWSFNDGSGGGASKPDPKPEPKPEPKPKPTPTPTPPPPPPPPPSTTSTRPKTTSKAPEPTTTSTSDKPEPTTTRSTSSSRKAEPSSSSVVSSTLLPSVNYSSGAASGLAVPTGVINSTPNQPETINDLNQAAIGMAAIVVGAAKANSN